MAIRTFPDRLKRGPSRVEDVLWIEKRLQAADNALFIIIATAIEDKSIARTRPPRDRRRALAYGQ
ncbi:hypothetical protein MASR2M16_08520 [Thauera terpenica]